MRLSASRVPFAWLLVSGLSCQAKLIDNLSFGYQDKISPDGNHIPGWGVSSVNHQPQILSDRIILTPPYPGNTRGAIWSDNQLHAQEWTAELEFRASGQVGGSGNLQLWFAKDRSSIGTDSVHTVRNFDGLALLFDKYGGQGGSLRGFLNDGTQNYQAHSNVEGLAFGNCNYGYRNLGRQSKLTVRNSNGLTVSIDDRECFSSDKISLPQGYYFGITAATPDQPDSFEISKFTVYVGEDSPGSAQGRSNSQRRDESVPQLQRLDRFPGAPEALPDQVADEFKSQEDQFADLHNRLQGLSHQVANIFGEIEALGRKIDEGNQRVINGFPSSLAVPPETMNHLTRRLDKIEQIVEQVRKDVEGKDYRETLNQLNRAINGVRGSSLTEDTMRGIISQSGPRMGTFVTVIIAVQILLAGAYILYKRRRASMPKKYL